MTINKCLKYIIYVGLFVVPFVPLYVATSMFFPFITGKNFAFRIIVEIVFALWLILALRDKNSRPKSSWLLYSVLALIIVDGLATVFSIYPYRSFWSNYERMDGYFCLLHLGAYFLVLISVFKDKIKWFWLANVSLLANIYIIIYSFLQLAGSADIHQGATRLDASLGNSAYLAVYVLFHIFIAGYLLLAQWSKNKILSGWYLLMILADIAVLYFTATRGAILGLVGGIVLICVLLAILNKNNKRVRKIAGALILATVLLIAGFWFVRNTNFVQTNPVLSRFATISLTETTTQSRFLIWQMSWQGFKDHPLLGWGPENYPVVFAKYYNPLLWPQEPWFDRSHNIFLDWLINAGLLGLISYLSIYLILLCYIWRRQSKEESAILTGLLAAYFFHNIFVFDNLISYILFFSLIAYVHFIVTSGNNSNRDKEEEKKFNVLKNYQAKNLADGGEEKIDLLKTSAIVATSLVLAGSLYYLNYKQILTSLTLIEAVHPQTAPDQSLVSFKKVFALNTFGSGEGLEQLINKTNILVANPQVSNKLKQQFVTLTAEEIDKSLAKFDQDARSYLAFSTFMRSIGQTDQSLAYLKKAQVLSLNKQQILFALGSAYIDKQDAPNAVATFKQAYELEPNYSEARVIYSLVLLMTSQISEAQKILAPIKNSPVYFNDDRFLELYKQMGDQFAIQDIMAKREALKKK